MAYEHIIVETRGSTGVVTLDRSEALNALNAGMIDEIVRAIAGFDADPKVGAVIVTGSEKAFAAGADIKEMADLTFVDAYLKEHAAALEKVAHARKPLIAAVAGYCLGGGCELAMMCDIIVAAENAKFGQPEITLGVMPGIGGTQRLPRAIGKARAMDLILTGRMIDAAEAYESGLVSRVVPTGNLMGEAEAVAEKIAGYSRPIVMMAKEAVNRSFEMRLSEGIRFERRLFHAMFATEDQKEGMAAFIDKRAPQFRNR